MRQTNAASISDPDPILVARGVIDANAYMTLATADRDGRPWASPVQYAHNGYTTFYWLSRPDARHSRNLATRPTVAIVIFDSTVAVGEAQAVYIEPKPSSSAATGIHELSRPTHADPKPSEPAN